MVLNAHLLGRLVSIAPQPIYKKHVARHEGFAVMREIVHVGTYLFSRNNIEPRNPQDGRRPPCGLPPFCKNNCPVHKQNAIFLDLING
ncbi:hypothetical protein Lspi_2667 [Legionella spiritensis]|uniref:Uncharacterized protein n=1 Tax=Legionella spiritensis TaxID=452 RepID=A0A0W0YX18_LEGSP|nr:hypothetical protein Lspi_2667 [Legionella spiritensis]SNV33355.1 Uncharacterised protein [Legionella spiritensis]